MQVSNDEKVIAVGAPAAPGSATGDIFIFTRSETSGTFTLFQTIAAPTGALSYGTAVAISKTGVYLAVGAPGSAAGGRVYAYRRTKGGQYKQVGPPLTLAIFTQNVPSFATGTNQFGFALAMPNSGKQLFIGE